MQFIKNRFVKITLWLIASILILFISVASALQTPYVQTKVVQYLSNILSAKTGFNIKIDRVSIDWFDQVTVNNLKIIDPENNTMGAIQKTTIDYNISSLISNNEIVIDHVYINQVDMLLTKISLPDSSSSVNITLFSQKIKELLNSNENKKAVIIENIDLLNSSFSYINNEKDSIRKGLDYYHFTINDMNGQLSNFKIIHDTVQFSLHNLNGIEQKTQLKINDIRTDFLFNKNQVELAQLNAQIGNTQIKNYLSFNYKEIKDFSNFNENIILKANLKNSVLHTKDISKLFPFKNKIYKKLTVSGVLKGKVSSFSFTNFNISFNNSNTIQGRLNMYGLPQLDETFVDLRLNKSYVVIEDIKELFLPKTQKLLNQFEHASFTGKFLGFTNDFVAAGNFNTNLGHIKSDINLKFFDDTSTKYTGNLEMIDFDLGKFSGKTIFNTVSLNSEIEGSGLAFSTADFVLNGEIQNIGINNYNYSNINTNARFAHQYFEGILKIDDPNLKMEVDGNIDLRKGVEAYNIDLNLEHAQLDSLKFLKQDVFVVADININASGLNVDEIKGKVQIKNAFIDYNNTPLFFDSLNIVAENIDDERRFKLTSDLIDWEFEGRFSYSVLAKELKNLYKEYKLNIKNDHNELIEYYANKPTSIDNESNILYKLQLKDISPLIHLFPGNNHISKNINLQGIYQSGQTTITAFSAEIDTIIFEGNQYINNTIDISSSKIVDSVNVLAAIYLSSEEQIFSNAIKTKNLFLETYWDKNHVAFETNIEQQNNKLSLLGNIDFLQDTTIIHFDSSNMILLENKWDFDQGNSIVITGEEIEFNKLNINSENRFISISGSLSKNKSKEAMLEINDFDMEFINPAIKKELSGQLNGFVRFRDVFGNPIVENELSIDEFKIDNLLVGDIFGKTTWRNNDQSLKVKAFVNREGFQSINVNGYYYPNTSVNPLDLRANFDKANVNILESFLSKHFSNIEGNATGVFTIRGKPLSPIIEGNGYVDNGTITVDYLNTDYRFSGNIGFDENNIIFNKLDILDVANNTGVLTGKISHMNFKNMVFDLKGDINNFQVLNTSSKDNDLFYGTGYATGTINFVGPLLNLSINALATTDKGTRFFIPIGDSENIKQEDFISFIDFNDTTLVKLNTEKEVSVSDVNLNFDLDITQDAYCEIIFDIKSGDIIRGRGEGRVNMQINTQGEFNMFGDYIFKQGGYNFTLYNIINKEFDIKPDSKISWYGDPYQGILDIEATYKQLTTLTPLVTDTSFHEIASIKRSYPVELGLFIDGPLLSPDINFDIDVVEYPSLAVQNNNGNTLYLEDVVSDFSNRINTDEHELNRQVFSLLVLKRFSPPESFNTAGTIGSSVSEFVSNQLSYWVSQVDENLEIDVDLGNLDEEAFNTFQLRLSYTLLDGRLRISREGGFGSGSSNEESQQNDIAGIVGDWTVEYILTEDGKLRAKMYNRTNYNALNNSLGTNTSTTTGVSILHTQNFDQIKDLWRREQKKKKEKEENEIKNSQAIIKSDEEI
ncbi:MAG: translocation/assembly module TamB [Cyclobacteriaceae bacterium]|nr:translocation/assembly module TamB [Cyclobacteriaceae bacterium]